MRLIDADALTFERITRAGDDEVVEVVLRDDLDAAPTIEPGRCGECATWGDQFDSPESVARVCRMLRRVTETHDFCSGFTPRDRKESDA